MNEEKNCKILMIDDEPNVISGFRRTIGRSFALTCAESGAAALALLESAGPFAVVITDMRMPEMNGLEFIMAARLKSRDSVYMMLTGNADQQTAIDAINQGHIFRFLNKPCSPEVLEAGILAALRQYDLVTAEHDLLRDTFAGSIKFMVEALELANPELFAVQARVKQIQQQLCTALELRDWQFSVAGSLCLLGLITLPGVVAQAGLTEETLVKVAAIGGRLLQHIPRIRSVVSMILRQREVIPSLPPDLRGLSPIGVELAGSQVLRFAVDLIRAERRSKSRAQAVAELAKLHQHDPRFIAHFAPKTKSLEAAESTGPQKMSVFDLVAGMVVGADVRNAGGTLLLSSGQVLSELALTSLRNIADQGLVQKFITVFVETPPSDAKAA